MSLQAINENRVLFHALFKCIKKAEGSLRIRKKRRNLVVHVDIPKKKKKPELLLRLERVFDEFQKSSQESAEASINKLMDCLEEIDNVFPLQKTIIERSIADQMHTYIVDIKDIIETLEDIDRNIWEKTERISRVLSSDQPNKFWWFGEKGLPGDLDLLQEIKIEASGEIKATISQAQSKIIKRSLKELLEFFQLNEVELVAVVDEMILNSPQMGFGKLPDPFVPHSFSQAILQLRKIRKMAKDLLIDEDIEDWLKTPQKSLSGKSARDAVIAGKGFRVLQILIRFGEGIF